MRITKLPWFIILAWLVSVLVCNIYIRDFSLHIEPTDEQIFGLVDAAVFISIGDMSQETLADYSIATLRKIGKTSRENISQAIYILYVMTFFTDKVNGEKKYILSQISRNALVRLSRSSA